MKPFFLLLTLLVVFNNLPVAQDSASPGIKRPRTHDDYQSRTLKAITSMRPEASELRDMQGTLVVTKSILPSRVEVTYTGSSRPIETTKKEIIHQWARLYAGSMEHYTEPYQTEMKFVENGVDYWLAVPKNSELLKREPKRNQRLELYLIRLGATTIREKYDWTLLVEDARQVDTSKSPAEIEFVDLRPGRPPLAYLTFDVRLRNDSESSRWFLLPSNIGSGHEPIGGKGGVDALESFLLLRTGRVTLGHFLGTGGFNALLLPAHADIRLRRFPISYWGELPDTVPIEIVIAKSLKIGSESAESWFESSPLSSKNADILTDADRAMRLGKTKHTPDNKEIAPAIDVERRVALQVSIKSR